MGLIVVCAVLGAVFGSFAGAVAARVPDGRSLSGRSRCEGCGRPLGVVDLVPVVSWLALRGRCRRCKAAIGASALVVEASVAGAWALLAWRLGAAAFLPAALAGATGLIAAGAVDTSRRLLPRQIVYPTGAVVLVAEAAAAATTGAWADLERAVAVAAVAVAGFAAIWATRPGSIGFGDVRLVGVCGLLAGWRGLPCADLALVASAGLGVLVAAGAMAVGKAGRSTRWPFGTFLAAGTVLAAGLAPAGWRC